MVNLMFLLVLGAEWLQAIELNPTDAEAYNNRGITYYFLGNIEKACADAKKACDLGDCKALNFLQSKGHCK